LSCGAHRCRLVCHKDACESCTQICGKPRRFCAHPHEAPCHAPSACSTAVPCQVMVDASCTCGNNVQRMMCGSSTSKPTSSAVAPLPCTDACAVLKRNAALAEALGIDPDRSTAPQSRPVEYEDETLEFYAANKAFAADIEQSLSDFLKSARQTLLFPPMKPPQRHYVKTVAALWNLSAQSLDAEPNRAVYVSKKSRSPPFQPSNSVGETCKTFLAPRAVQHLSLESKPAKTQWNALSLNAVFGLDESALRALIEPLVQVQAFTLDWLGEEDVLFRLVGVEEPDRQLRNIRTTLLGEKRIMASQGIDGVRVGSDGLVEWREDWSIASASTSKGAASSSAGGVQNRWSALAS
jgi:transcriptional repressor NF-X1